MARICCVESCKAVPKEDITFFNFPIKQSLLKKWKDAIKPTEALTLESVICSRHFASEDYETIRGRVRLKAKVVPSIFNYEDTPKSSEEIQKDPKENGHTNSPNESDEDPIEENKESNESNNKKDSPNETEEESNETNEKSNKAQEETKDSEAINNNCKDSSRSNDGESDEEEGSEEDGPDAEFEMPVELSCEVQLTEGDENETIECVPEAIIHEDSDSHSEGDLHKEDIEDIIANYHIKQDPKLAERLKASLEKENVSNNQHKSEKECNKSEKECNKSEKECNKSEKECNNSEKECNKSDKECNKRDLPPDKDNDCVEVSFTPSRKRRKPEYIEIPVDKDSTDKSNDCLMVMENVQVDIDPSMLLFAQDPDEDDSDVEETEVTETPAKDSKRKTDPISLLTSSDDDDVIIEEPHIDTVEVSDEDEDDLPLTKLVSPEPAKPGRVKMTKVAKILWGKAGEYYCVKCRYTTTSHGDYTRHREQHEKIFNVCEICNFSTASKGQFVRHKRSHKEEKCFKCFKCDYKAKHHMSLIYHLKSHGVEEREARDSLKVKKNKCQNCKMFFTNYQNEYLNHIRECRNSKLNKCSKCKYTTKRKSDLRRHIATRHGSDEESEGSEADDEENEEVEDEE